jgi:hypothetical protein
MFCWEAIMHLDEIKNRIAEEKDKMTATPEPSP